jgi:hypothetical protein
MNGVVGKQGLPMALVDKIAMGSFHGFFFEIGQRRKGYETSEGILGRE